MKLNLGIDFDGVITDPTELKIEWIKKNCGVDLKPTETGKHKAMPIIGKEAYRKLINDCYAGDWALRNKVRPEAVIVMSSLLQKGDNVYIITSRNTEETEKAKELIKIHGVPHSGLYNTSEEPKIQVCCQLKINIFLDDSQSKLEPLREVKEINLVFFNIYEEETAPGFFEVKNWEEFLELIERKRNRQM